MHQRISKDTWRLRKVVEWLHIMLFPLVTMHHKRKIPWNCLWCNFCLRNKGGDPSPWQHVNCCMCQLIASSAACIEMVPVDETRLGELYQ
jgi:hypothetical protein